MPRFWRGRELRASGLQFLDHLLVPEAARSFNLIDHDAFAAEIADLNRRLSSAEPLITPARIKKFARLLRDKLCNGPGDLKQAHVRLLLNEVRVGNAGISISGSKAILARGAAEGLDKPASVVLSFIQKWRAAPGEDDSYIYAIAL